MLGWLVQGGPKAAKHRGKVHPMVTFFVHYIVVAWVTTYVHDWIVARSRSMSDGGFTTCIFAPTHKSVGAFFGVYFLLFFSCRLVLRWHQHDFYIEFYKQTFLCSVTTFHAAIGLYTGRLILAQAFCVAVGVDQILWYIDLGGYLFL